MAITDEFAPTGITHHLTQINTFSGVAAYIGGSHFSELACPLKPLWNSSARPAVCRR